MVLLIATPTILSALDYIPESQRDDLQLPSPSTLSLDSPIAHSQVIALARYFTRLSTSGSAKPAPPPSSSQYYTLDSLLRGTRLYIPPPPPKPEPTKEYLELKAQLERRAEQQAYERLVSSHKNNPSATELANGVGQDDEEDEDDPLNPSLVINIFLSIVLTGFSTFWALRNFQTPEFLTFRKVKPQIVLPSYPGNPEPSRDAAFVLISLAVGIVVGVAEVVVYASYLRKVREAKKKERNKKERKVLIQSSTVDGGGPMKVQGQDLADQHKAADENDKEEIWGKGINGGVRRRVRERWEKEEDNRHG